MKKEMLINVLQPEECRIAILENGVLEELYVERTSHESYVGNIYKGRIVNIEPSIQAAFVDFGVGRNGFLHVSDVEPAYYRHLEHPRDRDRDRDRDREEPRGRRGRGERISRPGVVIPRPPRSADAESTDLADIPTMDELVEQSDQTPEAGSDMMLPPDLGLPADIAVASESFEQDLEIYEPEAPDVDDPAAEVEPAPTPEDIGDQNEDPAPEAATLAAPEEAAEPETEKPRRRSRGGRGRKTRGGRKSKSDASEESSAGSGPTPPEGDAEGPRPMGSAEHRTTRSEGDEPDKSSSWGSGLSASDGGRQEIHQRAEDFSDDELSFSARRREPEPEAESHLSAALERPLLQDIEPPEPLAEVEADSEPPSSHGDVLETPVQPESMHRHMAREFDEDLADRPPPRRGGRDRDRDRSDRRGGGRDRDRGDRRGGGGARRFPGGRSSLGRPKPLIQDIFRKGQEVLVQVIKEGIGTKGPTLSTYISIAGRYLVLMPGLNRIGVSRKIQDEEQRRHLRDIMNELKPPRGLGFIIRTAGLDRTKKELQRDLAYLARLWQVVVRRIKKLKSPAEIYQESDMITRTIRDTFTAEIQSIIIDEPKAFEHAQEFMQIVMPRYANRIRCYSEAEPIFHKYGIENELNRIHQKTVPLPNGGSIVIEQTEALVAIDVNSGNFRADNNAEETAYQINVVAAREIARQLRLRDLGGVVVNDFIDMREEKHRRGVERALRDAMRRDRARTKLLKMSQFGIIEMTRQRIRPSLKRSVYSNCPACGGAGQVKTCESMSIEVMRMLQLAAHREIITQIQVRVHHDVSIYLLNRKRHEIYDLEQRTGTQILVEPANTALPEFLQFACYDNNGNEIPFATQEPPRTRRRSYRD